MEETIDLINVAFASNGNFDVPDRKTALNGLVELQFETFFLCCLLFLILVLKRSISKRKWNFVKVNVSSEEMKTAVGRVLSLAFPRNAVMDVTIATAIWFAARGRGFLFVHSPHCKSFVCL
jgi:hypothetical protein